MELLKDYFRICDALTDICVHASVIDLYTLGLYIFGGYIILVFNHVVLPLASLCHKKRKAGAKQVPRQKRCRELNLRNQLQSSAIAGFKKQFANSQCSLIARRNVFYPPESDTPRNSSQGSSPITVTLLGQ